MINQETLKKFLQGKTTFTKGLSDILNALKNLDDADIIFQFLKKNKNTLQNKIIIERFLCLLLCLLWKYPDYCTEKNQEIYSQFQSLYCVIKELNGNFSQGLHSAISTILNTFSSLSSIVHNYFSFSSSKPHYFEHHDWFDIKKQSPNDKEEKVIAYLFGNPGEVIGSDTSIAFKDLLDIWQSLDKKSRQEEQHLSLSAFQKFTLQKFLHLSLLTYTNDFIIWAQTQDPLFNTLSQQLLESSLVDLPNIEEIRDKEFFKSLPHTHPFYKALYPNTSNYLTSSSVSFPKEVSFSSSQESNALVSTVADTFTSFATGFNNLANFAVKQMNIGNSSTQDSITLGKETSSHSSVSIENNTTFPEENRAPATNFFQSSQTPYPWQTMRGRISRSLPSPFDVNPNRPSCEYLQCAYSNLQEKLLVLHQQEDANQSNSTPTIESILAKLGELRGSVPLVHAENVTIPRGVNEARYKALQTQKNECWSRFSQAEFSNWDSFDAKLNDFLQEIDQLKVHYESDTKVFLQNKVQHQFKIELDTQNKKFFSLIKEAQLENNPHFQTTQKNFYTTIADRASTSPIFISRPEELNTKLTNVKSKLDVFSLVVGDKKENFHLETFIDDVQKAVGISPLPLTQTAPLPSGYASLPNGTIPQEVKALFAHFDTEISRYLLKKDQEDTHTKKRIAQLKMIKTHCLYQTTQYYISPSEEQAKSSIQRILSQTLDYYAKEFNVSQCKPGTMKSWLCCFKSTTANHLKSKAAELQHQNIEYMVNSTNI